VLALLPVLGCATPHIEDVAAPPPGSGGLAVRAVAPSPVGEVQPIAAAMTNGTDAPVTIDPLQIYAHATDGSERVTPLVAAEAARRAGGRSLGGVAKRGAVGAAGGSVLGAIGGAISGAIQGGIGTAVAAGAAVGAAVGAIGGVLTGGHETPARTSEFEARALAATTLAPGASLGGLLYYPLGNYRTLEVLAVERAAQGVRLEVPIETSE